MPSLANVKTKVAGYDPSRKDILNKALLAAKVLIMVGIFIAFAIYDSQNPLITMTTENELPFTPPNIFIEYARVQWCRLSKVDFTPQTGWDPRNSLTKDCTAYFQSVPPNQNKKPPSTFAYQFVPRFDLTQINETRFQMRINVTDCSWGNAKEIFYTVFDPNSLDLYADNLGACGFQSYINVRKQIIFRASGKKDVQYTIALNGFAPQRPEYGGMDASSALLNFMFDNLILVHEETSFGLFKRIITDAGGLVSVVSSIKLNKI